MNLNYPEFIIQGIPELTSSHFYWLSKRGVRKHFEFDTIGFGVQPAGEHGNQFVMYVYSNCFRLYQYKIDPLGDIEIKKKEVKNLYKERSNTYRKISSPSYIPDEDKRSNVLLSAEEYMKELESTYKEWDSWERTSDPSWYKKLIGDPIDLDEGSTIYDLGQGAQVLLDLCKVEFSTTDISMIAIEGI